MTQAVTPSDVYNMQDTKSKYDHGSFSAASAKLWNELPSDPMTSIEELGICKKSWKSSILNSLKISSTLTA